MPVAKVRLSDGRIARFRVPEGTSPDEVMAVAGRLESGQPAAPSGGSDREPPEKGFLSEASETMRDLGVSAVGGVGSMIGMAGDAYGLATGDMENPATRFGGTLRGVADLSKSDDLNTRERARAAKIAQADGELAKAGTAFWETLSDPLLFSTFLAEQSPMLIPGLGVGRAAGGAARLAGAGSKAAGTAGTAGAVGTGATMAAADAGGQAFDQMMALPDEIWEQHPGIQDARASGATAEQLESLRHDIALGLSRDAATATGVVSLATNLIPGARQLERVLGGGRGRGAGVLTSFAGEATQEAAEEGFSRGAANFAAGQVDPAQRLTEGVGEAAGMGAVGGVFGGAAGLRRGIEPPADVLGADNLDDALDAAAERLSEITLDQPMRLYHGTAAGVDFAGFDARLGGTGVGGGAFDQGNHFYTTTSRRAADWFARRAQENRAVRAGQMPDRSTPGDVLSFDLKAGSQILRVADMPRMSEANEIIESARGRGFDALQFADRGMATVEGDPEVAGIINEEGLPETLIVLNQDAVQKAEPASAMYAGEAGDFGAPAQGPINQPPIAEADRAFQALGAKDETLAVKGKRWLRRNFASGGLLPHAVMNEKIVRDSEFQAAEFDVAHTLGGFDRAVRQAYGQRYSKLPEADKAAIAEQLTSPALDPSLAEPVRDAVLGMRRQIDALSQEYIGILQRQAEELQGPEAQAKRDLIATIAGNMGEYAHRSYRAFDDPKWPSKISRQVNDEAVAYLENRYREAGAGNPNLRALQAVKTIVEEGTAYDSMESFIAESKLGAKDLSVLKRRQDIAPEIRALLGEYRDAKVNFTKSVTKMSRLISNQRFLDRLREIGMDEGFLWTAENRPPDQNIVKIAADESEVYAPLNGLYTYRQVNQALKDALGRPERHSVVEPFIRANALVKMGKTVFSPTTMARNWMSASMFALANGHFDFSQMRKSTHGLREYFGHRSDSEKLAYLRKLKKLGVVYDSPHAGELIDILHDSRLEQTLLSPDGPLRGLRKAGDFATKLYQYGDDFWKILGWENERRLLMKHKGMSAARAEKEAADRIRNTYPTYSLVPKFVRHLRRTPLVGTFVSFPAEIIRTTKNNLKYLAQDMKEAPAMARRRIAGMATVSAGVYGLSAVSAALSGIDDDEDEALRRVGPPWQRNANYLHLGYDDEGKPVHLDLSHLDAYALWKKPLNAVMRNQPWEDKFYEAAKEAFLPFFGEDIAFGALREVISNDTGHGRPVFNVEADPATQTAQIANHLRKALQPGVASNVERTAKAAAGVRKPSGPEYDLSDEALAWGGIRSTTADPVASTYYKGFEFGDRKRRAQAIFQNVARDLNRVSRSDLAAAYRDALEARMDAYADMIKVTEGARSLGATNEQLEQALRMASVSKTDISAILRGKVPRWLPSDRSQLNAMRRARAVLGEDVSEQMRRRRKDIVDMVRDHAQQ